MLRVSTIQVIVMMAMTIQVTITVSVIVTGPIEKNTRGPSTVNVVSIP